MWQLVGVPESLVFCMRDLRFSCSFVDHKETPVFKHNKLHPKQLRSKCNVDLILLCMYIMSLTRKLPEHMMCFVNF